MEYTRYTKEAIEIAKIVCANPSNNTSPNQESALQVSNFIKTLAKELAKDD